MGHPVYNVEILLENDESSFSRLKKIELKRKKSILNVQMHVKNSMHIKTKKNVFVSILRISKHSSSKSKSFCIKKCFAKKFV